jgi:hypothetical protein
MIAAVPDIRRVPGGQTLSASLMEALVGIATSFALSLMLQTAMFPNLGLVVDATENLTIAGAFTLLSVLRSFIVRRLFNWLAFGKTEVH